MSCHAEAMNNSAVQHFSTQFERLTSLEEAGQTLAESAQSLGWELVAFHADVEVHSLPRARDGQYIARAMGWPQDYIDQWVRQEMGRHCPVGQRGLSTMRPFLWDSNAANASWSNESITPKRRQVLDHYQTLVSGGLAIPVRHADGKIGYVSWCTRESISARLHDDANLESAVVLSHAFIRHAARLQSLHTGVANVLSERERECLSWVARGKTEQEIAQILHRSAATIHFHIGNAITKLHAVNRTHAVAIACTRRLIYADLIEQNYRIR